RISRIGRRRRGGSGTAGSGTSEAWCSWCSPLEDLRVNTSGFKPPRTGLFSYRQGSRALDDGFLSAPLRSVLPQSCSTRHAPLVANRLGLTLNVGEEGRVVISLQPHFDEGPEADLETHRELDRVRRLPRQDPSLVQEVLRENEEDFRLVREHHHPLPAQLTPEPDSSSSLVLYN